MCIVGKVFLNGQLIDRAEAKLDIEDRGNLFGDGIYEVIRVYNGELFTLEEHLRRFMSSAEKIRLTIPYDVAHMAATIKQLVRENQLELGIVYLQATRGATARKHLFPNKDVPTTFFAYTKSMPRPLEQLGDGVKVKTMEDIRWLKCDIKSLNLLANILAKQSAADDGCFEAIFHRDELVTEGSSSNIHIVKNGRVKTHPANHLILNGVVRQVMINHCGQIKIPVEETAFSLPELLKADEVFMTSTTAEVMPIVEINGQLIGDGRIGVTTAQLQRLYEQEINKQCKKQLI